MRRNVPYAVIAGLLAAQLLALEPAAAAARFAAGLWDLTCDNARDCTVTGGGSSLIHGAYVRIDRSGRASARARVLVGVGGVSSRRGGSLAVTVDISAADGAVLFRRTVRAAPDVSQRMALPMPAGPFLAALRRGAYLTITVEGEAQERKLGLGEAMEALRGADSAQRRAGTRTALVTRGPRPAGAVPPPPALPVIYRAPAVTQAGLPTAPPAAVRRAGRANSCDEEADGPPRPYRLSWGRVLWIGPCQNGSSYNPFRLVMITDERGRAVRGFGDLPSDGVSFDARRRVLKAAYYCRQAGDCGQVTEWVWDGRRFVRMQVTGSSYGVADWPASYRTTVREGR